VLKTSRRHTCFVAASVAFGFCGCIADVTLPDVDAVLAPPLVNPPTTTSDPVPLPETLRLLSGAEYRATVKDLVGVDVSPDIDHRHLAGGYDTGAHGTMQEALFASLVDEVERVADVAVTTTLPQQFPCLNSGPDLACASDVTAVLARRAWRRPTTPNELEALMTFFAAHSDVVGDARGGLSGVVARLLLSPELLYRPEVGRGAENNGIRALDAFEQVTLLSYALTGAGPDDALLDLAEQEEGALSADTLRVEAHRLAQSERGRARVADMVRHWVRATALDDMVLRPEDFAKLTSPDVARGLKGGFDAFVEDVAFGDDGTLAGLLSSPFAMVNQHTAPLVGVDGPFGDDLERVTLPSSERRGLLTQPGLLAAHGASGEADKDRPVQRGYMMKTQLLCEPIGPPSGLTTSDAANAAAGIPGFDDMTTRGQYEAMMEQGPSCTACHAQFMPLGFAFGRYDALGRYRTEQRGQAVDASALGVQFLGETRDFDDGLALSDTLAGEPVVAACFAQNVAAFVTGQGSAAPAIALGADVARDDDGSAAIVDTLVDAVVRAATYPRATVVDDAPPDVDVDIDVDVDVPPVDEDDDADDDIPPVADDAELVLGSGVELRPSQQRTAHGGAFTLVYQGDGNLVLYEQGVARWSSGTDGEAAHVAVMQGDGNLVVYAQPGAPVFHTGTNGNAGAGLYLRRDGTLEVRANDGRVLHTIAPQ